VLWVVAEFGGGGRRSCWPYQLHVWFPGRFRLPASGQSPKPFRSPGLRLCGNDPCRGCWARPAFTRFLAGAWICLSPITGLRQVSVSAAGPFAEATVIGAGSRWRLIGLGDDPPVASRRLCSRCLKAAAATSARLCAAACSRPMPRGWRGHARPWVNGSWRCCPVGGQLEADTACLRLLRSGRFVVPSHQRRARGLPRFAWTTSDRDRTGAENSRVIGRCILLAGCLFAQDGRFETHRRQFECAPLERACVEAA